MADYCSKLGGVFLVAMGAVLAGCGGGEKAPPAPNVVASYDNGRITVEDLEDYIELRTAGLKMLVGDSLVALDVEMPDDKEFYRNLIREMVLDEMIKRKIKEKQLDNRGNIRHALQHLEEELTLQQLHTEMHEKDKIPVGELEIQQYYDENRSRFGDKSFYEVRDEIKSILASQREGEYVVNYIAELADAATITKNYEILRVPEPTEDEVRRAYEEDKESYREPERWVIDLIEIADTTAKARDRAQRAWTRLGSGESFESVAEGFGRDSTFTSMKYATGMRGEAFDKAVTSLNPGEYSKPIQEGRKFFIVRLREKIPASYIPFEMVKDVVRRFLADEREEQLYEQNESKTLFTIHGRRFTLGDFYQEFKELPPAEQEKHRSYEERIKLVDQMLERLLLLEDSYDRMLNAERGEEIEHMREDILRQALHQEEVDEKLEVSEEEARAFYEENKEHFRTPGRVKISLIVVRGGDDEASDKKAKAKIDEAYGKLKSRFLKKGMPFEDVAKQYSEDPTTAQNGGRLDYWISETGNPLVEMLDHAFHEKFIDLDEGAITEPFRVRGDYVIVKVREKEDPQLQPFEEVREHLVQDLKLQKHDELTARMYDDMIDQAGLTIYDQVLESIINRQKEVSGS